jgi:NAD(P)H-dependent flavin oxidoreductase YrpB (nitropropane dioxygenase family)
MLTTKFTSLIGCSIPIQQAGMGGVATADLAAAVSAAGGLGMLGAVRLPASFLANILSQLRQQTKAPFGVNFLMPFLDQEALEVAASLSRVVEIFYGDPDPKLVGRIHAGGALACWQVGSVEEARAAEAAGCDLIVAQGVEAGGHVRSRIGLFPLLEQVLDAVDVPVVAAGGIGTPRGVAAALAAGAAAVRVGTLFVAAEESAAHPLYKEALVGARAEDTLLTQVFSVMWPDAPHRVLRSCVEAAELLPDGVVGQTVVAGVTLPLPRFAVPTPTRAATGKVEAMPLYAGESVGGVRAVRPAAEILRELAEEAEALLRRWAG